MLSTLGNFLLNWLDFLNLLESIVIWFLFNYVAQIMAILANFLFQTCQKQGHRNQQNLKNRLQGTSPHGTSLIGQVLRVSSTSPMHKSNAPRTISWVALSLSVKWTDSDTSMNAAKQVKIWCTKLSVMTGRLIVVCAKILLTEKETSFLLPAKPWIALTEVS